MKDYLNWAKEIFKNDLYATETTGIKIEDVKNHYAKCSLNIEKKHLNAGGNVMGGAIFTLADFTFAIAANTEIFPTVSISSNINFINSLKGKSLIAEAKCIKSGKSTCHFTVEVKDDIGTDIANVSITGFRNSRLKELKNIEG